MLSCFEIFGPACFNKVQLLFWRKFKYFDTLNGKKAALFPWSLLALQFWWLKLQRKLPICYSVVFLPRQVAFIGLADKRLHEIPLYLKNPILMWQLGNHFLCFISLIQYCTKYPFFFCQLILIFMPNGYFEKSWAWCAGYPWQFWKHKGGIRFALKNFQFPSKFS